MNFAIKHKASLFALLLVTLSAGCIHYMPGDGLSDHLWPWQRTHVPAKVKKWYALGAKVNPLLAEYYTAHPSRFSFPHHDSEAAIEGFPEYAAQHGIHLKSGSIIDPWGDPVHFIVALNGEENIRARGQTVWYGKVRAKFMVGLLIDEPWHVEPQYAGDMYDFVLWQAAR